MVCCTQQILQTQQIMNLPCNDIICLILLDIYKYLLFAGRHFLQLEKSLSQFLKFVFLL